MIIDVQLDGDNGNPNAQFLTDEWGHCWGRGIRPKPARKDGNERVGQEAATGHG